MGVAIVIEKLMASSRLKPLIKIVAWSLKKIRMVILFWTKT